MTVTRTRRTKETCVKIELNIDTAGPVEVATGVGFLDHLLTALAWHAGWTLRLSCDGDLHIDDHHTAEDSALALGEAFDAAMGDRSGRARFGSAYAPLDESLARAVVDLATRPFARAELGLRRPAIGSLAAENVAHVVLSFAQAARINVHLDVLTGENDHHRAEAAFKALALALRSALEPRTDRTVASTKGVL